MKTNVKNGILQTILITLFGLMLEAQAAPVTFTSLYGFPPVVYPSSGLATNSVGAYPSGGLVISPAGDTLYGTTGSGGILGEGRGTVFALSTDGIDTKCLHTFTAVEGGPSVAGLVLSENVLYGTSSGNGSPTGTVFAVNTDGTDFKILHRFTASEGGVVKAGLMLSGDTLYGTTSGYSGANAGTVFSINTDGSSFKTLHVFTGDIDGGRSHGGLVLSGNTLFGTLSSGGISNNGAIFAINTDGSGFKVLHRFTATLYIPTPPPWTNADGANPNAGLILSWNTLYGTAYNGGANGSGTVFALNTDGTGFRTLHSFGPWVANGFTLSTNNDGAWPSSSLVILGNTLYGATSQLGPLAGATLFSVNTDGTDFANVYVFMKTMAVWLPDGNIGITNSNGSVPNSLALLGHTIYGTTLYGGTNSASGTNSNSGTVFSLSFPTLSATVAATPRRVQIGESIQVVVTVQNHDSENITGVQLKGSITVAGAGGVTPAGFRGSTMIPGLAPGTKSSFTYLYTATNDGLVSFTAAATGTGRDGVVTSPPATSPIVTIATKADLLVKTADPKDTTFLGGGQFQSSPANDQDVNLPVSSKGVAAYVVRLQNGGPAANTFVLRATTNTFPNWKLKVLANNVNIFDAMTSASGWTTPTLASSAFLDMQVSLAPMTNAGVMDRKSLLIKSLANDTSSVILDALILHASLVPVPVKATLHAVTTSGLTKDSIQAGKANINAPLVPVVDPALLDAQPQIHAGLIADGVTPMIIRLAADPSSIGQFADGLNFGFAATILSGGSLNGDSINQRLRLLKEGAWQAATNVVLTADNPIAYVQVLPILSDDLVLTGPTPGLYVRLSVQDTASKIEAGEVKFTLSKPPIALIHGYNTTGDWGTEFRTILGASRLYDEADANNLICTVKYGQDSIPPAGAVTAVAAHYGVPVYVNTVASLNDCARMALTAFNQKMAPLHSAWAFTRFDVVAHSQGGVLSRMLCNAYPNSTLSDPFRNPDNFNRGRFHRVVTIGSPHNGSRLLRYMLDLYENGKYTSYASLPEILAFLGVESATAQAKFDPFGVQFAALNDPSPIGPWQPDSAASFHMVRTVIDNGLSPGYFDLTPAYIALGLNSSEGGASVIPRGSDGVVDLDSMGANVPPTPVAPNVFTFSANNVISHAAPMSVFGSSSYQTASTIIAAHVIGALDQDASLPPDYIRFGSFQVPARLSGAQMNAIDIYAATVSAEAAINALALLAIPLDSGIQYSYGLNFPSNRPPVSTVAWFVQVYGPSGITSDGVELSPRGTNDSQVVVTVDKALIGDVVLSATYRSVSNTVVVIPPVVVVSLHSSEATLTGIEMLPGSIGLPVGEVVSPKILAHYSDGSSSLRYAAPGTITAVSSKSSVVSVNDPSHWQLASVGTAQIIVTWSGHKAASQVTVFDPATPPALSISRTGLAQADLTWPGFALNYDLESTTDLHQTNSWQPVVTEPVHAGGMNTVSISATNTLRFFRLRSNAAPPMP